MINFKDTLSIGGKLISEKTPPLIVAEISGNHSKDISKAFKMLDILKKIGVGAVKIQSYQPSDITLPGLYNVNSKSPLWANRDLFSLFQEGTLSYEQQSSIIDYSKKIGLEIFSSPFSIENVQFLIDKKVNAFKIASFELNHFPMLKIIAESKKPVILSTGVSSLGQIKKSLNFLYKNGTRQCIVLKTTSSYPADPKDSNLKTIKYLKNELNTLVGISDHTNGIGASILSIGLGACLIEKHFTLDKNDGALDSSFSLEPSEFKSLVDESRIAFESLGKINLEVPENNLIYKRSIFSSKKIKKGEKITEKNIQVLRPYLGIDSENFFEILGRTVNKEIKANQPIKELDLYEK